jgi:hypothetical protein
MQMLYIYSNDIRVNAPYEFDKLAPTMRRLATEAINTNTGGSEYRPSNSGNRTGDLQNIQGEFERRADSHDRLARRYFSAAVHFFPAKREFDEAFMGSDKVFMSFGSCSGFKEALEGMKENVDKAFQALNDLQKYNEDKRDFYMTSAGKVVPLRRSAESTFGPRKGGGP